MIYYRTIIYYILGITEGGYFASLCALQYGALPHRYTTGSEGATFSPFVGYRTPAAVAAITI